MLAAWWCWTCQAAAGQSLHERLDAEIAARWDGPASPLAEDAEFLRRVWLDLAGTIPSAAEVREFLSDTSVDKRTRKIDELLASPAYARRMQQTWSVMLLERRPGAYVAVTAWESFLEEAFAENRPWDVIVRQIIAGESDAPTLQGAMKFCADRVPLGPEQLTRDVGRLFLGRDLQCAQCHDHPQIEEYKQVHFQGLLAFLNRTYLHNDAAHSRLYLAEKGEGGPLAFASVFVPGVENQTGPRLLEMAEVALPQFPAGEEYAAPAGDGRPAVPKFRPRLLLAEQLTASANRAFADNAVNRVWFLLLGRGLVEPLDQLHAGNPPTHPSVLALLAEHFIASGYDLRALVREIALSQTYQRSSELPVDVALEDAPSTSSYRTGNLKRLSAEQLAWATLTATGELDIVLQATAAAAQNGTAAPSPVSAEAFPPTLDAVYARFRAAVANPPGEPEVEFTPSLAGALFWENDAWIDQWLQPASGNLTERLLQLPDAAAVADELYLSVLSRYPTDAEREAVVAQLAGGAAHDLALKELAWSLLASLEFQVNH